MESTATTETAILADRLRKTFDDVVAVDQISLAVPHDTVLGLLGANGAGKTTTVRMLTTVLKPTSGRGVVNGFDVLVEQQAVRRNIGLAGQYAAIDENLTGRENLVLVGRLTHISKAADRLADNIVVIDKGLIAAEGTATQLKARLGDTVIEFELADAAIANTAGGLLGAPLRPERWYAS